LRRLQRRLVALFSPEALTQTSVNSGVYVFVGLLLFVTVVLVPFAGIFDLPDTIDQGDTVKGKIERLVRETTEQTPFGTEVTQTFDVRVGDSVHQISYRETVGGSYNLGLEAGDEVLVTIGQGPQGDTYFIADRVRESSLWLFGLLFGGIVLIVGRLQGFTSLIGMVASLLVILRFIIPGIASGADPVTISLIGSAVILAASLFLSHGVNGKTLTALLGTTGSLVVTALLSSLAIDMAHLSGLGDEDSRTLRILTQGAISSEGLLLSAIIIGSLGVLDDVCVAQASAVFELRAANPLLGARELFSRAMNIGRDHIASTVNTLFLAYTGSALPLLVILSLQTEPLGTLVNREFLSTEVLRTLVGSIGIVASVPVTTALAAFVSRSLSKVGVRGPVGARGHSHIQD
jgi:uncharacterized membrane protein